MGIVLETLGALKPATLNWLASQVRVRCLFFSSPSSILALDLDSFAPYALFNLHCSFASHKAFSRCACRGLQSYASAASMKKSRRGTPPGEGSGSGSAYSILVALVETDH
jgi:hypothetical protein